MQIQNVHFHLGRANPAAIMAACAGLAAALVQPQVGSPVQPTLPASADPSKADGPKVLRAPRVGAYWEGQGGIYVGIGRGYDAPDYHLLLATDPRAIFRNRSIGTYGQDVQGATSGHDSLANTIALAEAGSDLCNEIRALSIEGHNDFALMSRTDARLCMANVPEQFEKDWHLLSTQSSAGNVWGQYFSNGYQDTSHKKFEALARAVRRLPL